MEQFKLGDVVDIKLNGKSIKYVATSISNAKLVTIFLRSYMADEIITTIEMSLAGRMLPDNKKRTTKRKYTKTLKK